MAKKERINYQPKDKIKNSSFLFEEILKLKHFKILNRTNKKCKTYKNIL